MDAESLLLDKRAKRGWRWRRKALRAGHDREPWHRARAEHGPRERFPQAGREVDHPVCVSAQAAPRL
eukprot:4311760-Alexandrium_andersonii.AAC.1